VKADAPIHNLHAIDIVGHRVDGGVDLAVVCTGPLDDSWQTVRLLDRKVSAYLTEIQAPGFNKSFNNPTRVRVMIYCQHAISTTVLGMINVLAGRAAAMGVELLLDRSDVDEDLKAQAQG
jgi:hypothetical protein